MKKIFLLTSIVLLAMSAALAQEQKPLEAKAPAEKTQAQKDEQKSQQAKQAEEYENKIKTELKLTEDQLAKYNALSKEFKEKKEALMKDASLTDDARKEKKAALRKEKEAKFLELLTPEQQAKFRQITEEMDKKKEAQKKGF